MPIRLTALWGILFSCKKKNGSLVVGLCVREGSYAMFTPQGSFDLYLPI